MGSESIVSGHIQIRGAVEETKAAINSFDFFDEKWPFTNIFWCDSPAQYLCPVVGFAGSYKQVEEVWSEWLWKFGQLLTTLDAYEARVNLKCIIGDYSWRLMPKICCQSNSWPKTMIGQQWVIVSTPEQDFSIDPEWLRYVENNLATPNKETGELIWYKWEDFLERIPLV